MGQNSEQEGKKWSPGLLKISSSPKNTETKKKCMTKEAVIFLFIAIVVEVIATISLKLSDSFTRLVPSLVTIIGYCIAFWCLTIPMRTIPAGIIYAIWSGVGIVLIGLMGWLFLGQKLDMPAIVGMLLIICGVIVINLFSKSVSH